MSNKQSDADTRAIQAGIANWAEAVREKNVDRIMAYYAPEVVAFDAVQTLQFKGTASYREHWKFCMDMCSASLVFQIDELDVQVDGDLAVAHALVSCGMEDENGKVGESGYSRMTASYRRSGSGWQATHEHFSFPFDMQTGRVLFDLKPAKDDAQPAVRAIPAGMNTVIPHLVCANASEAIDFYKQAFGANEESRLEMMPGMIAHACLRIAGSVIFLMDEAPQWGALGPKAVKGTPITIHLYVADVDAAFDKAMAAGATAIMAVQDMIWGDRYGVVEDPFGHRWSLATHVRDLTQEQINEGAKAMMSQDCPAASRAQ